MKKQVEMALVVMCLLSVFPTFGSWVETFDSGVGRLNQTTGPGDTCYVWDSSNQAILGHFYRAHTYKRFALLEKTVNAKDAVMGFSAVVTPLYNGKPTDMNPGAAIGFMDSSDADSDNRYTVVFLGKTSVIVSAIPGHGGKEIPYSVNHTYFIDAFLNGPGNYFSIDIFEGTDRNGIFQGNITTPIRTEYDMWNLNALGMANGLNASGLIYRMDVRINEISYIEPTLIINSPNGNESYIGGATQDITWSADGVGNQVLLQYSVDNGSTWVDDGSNNTYNHEKHHVDAGKAIWDTYLYHIDWAVYAAKSCGSEQKVDCLIKGLDKLHHILLKKWRVEEYFFDWQMYHKSKMREKLEMTYPVGNPSRQKIIDRMISDEEQRRNTNMQESNIRLNEVKVELSQCEWDR